MTLAYIEPGKVVTIHRESEKTIEIKNLVTCTGVIIEAKDQILIYHLDEDSYDNCSEFGLNLKVCPCKKVRYCNRTCQRAHWKIHKQQYH